MVLRLPVVPVLREGEAETELRLPDALVLRLPDALELRLVEEAPLILVLEEPVVLTLLFTVVRVLLPDTDGVVLLAADALVPLCPEAVLLLLDAAWVAVRTDLAAELVFVVFVRVTASASRLSLRILAFTVLADADAAPDLLLAMMSALRSVNECSGCIAP